MRLAFFSDIHGNLPALEAILDDIQKQNIDYAVFMGDAIGLGPRPYECLKLLLDSNVYFNYGNHEQYAYFGIEHFENKLIEKELVMHSRWVKEQVKDIINRLDDDPKVDEDMLLKFGKNKIYLCHYASKDDCFLDINNGDNNASYLKTIFDTKYNYIFYGHNHEYSVNKTAKTTFICLGSSGCVKDDNTFYMIVDIKNNLKLERKFIKYNRNKLLEDFNNIDFPEKEMLGKIFFGIVKE